MADEKKKNPFRPGVGTPPRFLAGRDSSIARFRALLRSAPELPANMRMTGLRGVGKTVLLNKLSEAAIGDNWFSSMVELQPGHNNESELKKLLLRITNDAKYKISVKARVSSAIGQVVRQASNLKLTWNDMTFGFELDEDQDMDISKELFETVKLALENGYEGYVLLLDESQVIKDDTRSDGQHPLSLLISCISTLQRNGVPIGLVLCGLPTLTSNLLRARSYTERMFRGEEISSLTGESAMDAFTQPLKSMAISYTDQLVKEVIDEVEGYPYFIQLWGAELWDAAVLTGAGTLTSGLLNAIRDDIYRRLDLDFYQPRVQTLTPAEQDVLLATIECTYPPLSVSNLKDASDKTAKNVNVLLGRLVEAGVIYRLRKGQYEYTAPKFRQYLERHSH